MTAIRESHFAIDPIGAQDLLVLLGEHLRAVVRANGSSHPSRLCGQSESSGGEESGEWPTIHYPHLPDWLSILDDPTEIPEMARFCLWDLAPRPHDDPTGWLDLMDPSQMGGGIGHLRSAEDNLDWLEQFLVVFPAYRLKLFGPHWRWEISQPAETTNGDEVPDGPFAALVGWTQSAAVQVDDIDEKLYWLNVISGWWRAAGRVEQALSAFPPDVIYPSTPAPMTATFFPVERDDLKVARWYGYFQGRMEERKQSQSISIAAPLKLEEMALSQKRMEAKQRTQFELTLRIAEHTADIVQKQRGMADLLLDQQVTFERLAVESWDRVATELIAAYDASIPTKCLFEQTMTATAWQALSAQSRSDLIAVDVIGSEDREPNHGLRTIGLTVVFERELRQRARTIDPSLGGRLTLGKVLRQILDSVQHAWLRQIASRAISANVDSLRNRAAHGQRVTESDFTAVLNLLLEDGLDGQGLLSNVVMLRI